MKKYIRATGSNNTNLILYRDFAEKALGEYIEDANFIESEYNLHQDYDDYNYWLSGSLDDINYYIKDLHLEDYGEDGVWRISEDKYGDKFTSSNRPNMRKSGLTDWRFG